MPLDRRISGAICILGLLVLTATEAQGQGQAAALVSGAIAAEKFNIYENDYIRVPVRVFNRDCSFCLDTGAATFVFHPEFLDLLGKPIDRGEAQTVVANSLFEAYAPPDMIIGREKPEAFRTERQVLCCARTGVETAFGRHFTA